jgi:tyrosine-protein phosphatase SIW14
MPRTPAALLPLLLLAACGTAEPPATSPPAAPPAAPAHAAPVPEWNIPNAARLAEGVFRGAQPDGKGLATLKAAGVRTLVSFRTGGEEEDREARALGFEVVPLPIEARLESEPPTDAQVARFFEVVLDPAKRPVYFHCAFGRDRTGTMAAIYRIEVDGWSNADALAEMKAFGFRTWYRDLEKFVREYRPRGFRPPGPAPR